CSSQIRYERSSVYSLPEGRSRYIRDTDCPVTSDRSSQTEHHFQMQILSFSFPPYSNNAPIIINTMTTRIPQHRNVATASAIGIIKSPTHNRPTEEPTPAHMV